LNRKDSTIQEKKERKKMKKPQILRDADRVILSCFLGIAIPHQPSLADGVYGPIRSEKVLKFNRKALRNRGKAKAEKIDPRYNGGDDTMIIKVGKPGSRERVEALRSQYEAIAASGEELSAFSWEG
jgi:tRNA G37 N-methylase TrmD